MKNYWLELLAKRHSIWGSYALPRETQEQIHCFMGELKEMIAGKDDPDLIGMDFKPLYAKYPRVRLGIRRAILAARKQCRESN